MSTLILRNVTVTDSQSPHHGKTVDLRIENGHIAEVAAGGSMAASGEVLEAPGLHVSPGWLDMRVHLTDPGYEWKEDLSSLAAAASAGGFTAVMTMPNTLPVVDNASMVKSLRSRAANLPVHLLPAGALSVGAKGADLAEVYDMHQAGAVAFTDGIHATEASGLVLRALQYLKPFDGLLINFPLDHSLAGNAEVAEGPSSTRVGMKGIPAIAEELMVDRDLRLLEYFEHRLHLAPVTTAGAVARIHAAKQQFKGLSAETSAIYLLLDDSEIEQFDPNVKVFPPLRDKAAVAALRKAVAEGVIDVVSSSHHPQSIEEKVLDFASAAFGATGLETCFAVAWTGLSEAGVPLDKLVDCLTANPRRILRQEALHIEEGAAAELTLFQPDAEWTVSAADLASKSKNNPFVGRTLRGRVFGTYCKGRLNLIPDAQAHP